MSIIHQTEAALTTGVLPRIATSVDGPPAAAYQAGPKVALSLHDRLEPVEPLWRAFEQTADATVFQTYDWLSAWVRHVAPHGGTKPVIVVGSDDQGATLFILPLAIEAQGIARRLTWLGSDLSDYNAPLLAKDFAARIEPERFLALWREVIGALRRDGRFRFDAVLFGKMPERVGSAPNPFAALPTSLNPSGAYATTLTGSWEAFYSSKRSSATRRRDRTKRKRLTDIGEVRFLTAENPEERARTLGILFEQKAKSFQRMGVADIFARPGHRDFFLALATNAALLSRVHVSHLDVGETEAAVNFGLIFAGCYYHVLASYTDGEAAKYGPGAAHLHDLMRYAIEHGCRVFDFTIGDEPYKRDWSDVELRLLDHQSAVTWRGYAVTLPAAVFARVKRLIKQTPFLWRMFTRTRAILGGAAKRPQAEAADES